ncbi:MAG TPA: DUF885 domain-containing protein [Actinomycetota bacterium]|nr:DUF885 domain-containing protein [Actinomycetota bacterium]
MSEGPSPVFGVADRFVRRWAELEPSQGLIYGLAGTPGRLSDWSPQGRARVADALREGLAELDRTPPRGGADRRAAAVMRDRLQVWLASTTAQDWARELDAGFLSPPAMDRMALATAPLADAGDAELLASRLTAVPAGMQGYAAALRVGLDEGRPGPGVLAARLVAMLRASARSDGGYFAGLAGRAAALPGVGSRTARQLGEAGRAADGAYDQLADWLEDEYLSRAAPDPAVGPERYARALQDHLGQTADPVELASWGWEELDRLEQELRREAAAGWPGVPLAEVVDRLDHDPGEPSAAGPAALLDWLGQLDQQVARRLAGEFDIPPQLRVLRHELAPPGSAAGAYYLPPTEDGARPGVVVWTMPAGRVPLWRWQTFSHHEGMPGHHLELGGVRFLPAPLSRFQTCLGEISGYSEGWGLYAERFMDELGAFDRPATRLGFLISQSFRAVRVVVDTGLHLGLRVPASLADPAAGQVITPQVAVGLLVRHGWQTPDDARSEVLRYLGCPAQAVAYKFGEREWLRVRAQARRRLPGLTNRQFHAAALRLGPLPLRLLGPEVLTALEDVAQE